jgi:hypothetical protein
MWKFVRSYWSILLLLFVVTVPILALTVLLGGYDSLVAVVLIDTLVLYLVYQDYKMKP